MNLPHVLQDFLHDRAVARDDRDAPVATQVADDAPGLGEDQFGGADVPFVQRQFPVAVQQSGGDAADVVGRRTQPPLSQLHYYPNQRSVCPVKQIIIRD